VVAMRVFGFLVLLLTSHFLLNLIFFGILIFWPWKFDYILPLVRVGYANV